MSITLEEVCSNIWVVVSRNSDGFGFFLADSYGNRFWAGEESIAYITTYTKSGARSAASYYRNQYGVKRATAIPLSRLPEFLKEIN